jgi:hypothetical protein
MAPPSADWFRRALLVLLLLGSVGTGAELLLMEHVEDIWQLIPVILIGLSLAVLGWYGMAKTSFPLRILQILMLLTAGSGVAGTLLHYRGNVEFELEMMPGLGGVDLFQAAMMGATPALAPGTMIILGAMGLLYTWKHPALAPQQSK